MLSKIVAQEDDVVEVGGELGVISEAGEAPAEYAPPPPPPPPQTPPPGCPGAPTPPPPAPPNPRAGAPPRPHPRRCPARGCRRATSRVTGPTARDCRRSLPTAPSPAPDPDQAGAARR
ncbi:hypothetical protein [Nocardia farcinica]|uniref:hypothetical protein n=1 Tax=Nocardia farcinica TaxID=37329 RepID=UPI003CC7DECB